MRRFVHFSVLLVPACGLAPIAPDMVSYGSANSGVLFHPEELPARGAGFVRARRDAGARFGAPRLVAALVRAAATVQRVYPQTSALRIGDLSSRGGGDQQRHGSHRTGRDADVLFYLLDVHGVSIPGSGFFAFGTAPAATYRERMVFFDTARNWQFVRTLLSDEHALVQWIFCGDGIKARLLRFASRHERDPRVLMRAAYVLHQPSYGNPHRDHFHIRVACSAEERAWGCRDEGPTWPWLRNEHEKPAWEGLGYSDEVLRSALLAPFDSLVGSR